MSEQIDKIECKICGGDKCPYRFSKGEHKLFRCEDCETTFLWPIPSDTSDVYAKSYFKNDPNNPSFGYTDYDEDKKSMEDTFSGYLSMIEPHVEQNRIFDVGAATGYFLDLAKKRGWQTAGIDLSSYAAGEASNRGHAVVTGRLPESGVGGRYDLVTMWDVLEHVDDPAKYMNHATKLLDEGGFLALTTIDSKSVWARLMGRFWHLIVPPEHIFYFNKKSLVDMIESSGLEVVKVDRPHKKFSLAYIFKVLYKWQGLKIWQKLYQYFEHPRWRKISIPLNFYDNLFILAKKS